MVERLSAQTGRRFVKTHSPADAIPVDDRCRYVCVFRAGPAALVSWGNHRRRMRPMIGEALNELSAADGIPPIPPVWDGDWEVMFSEWIAYADLFADLEGEMRTLATWLAVDVSPGAWPDAVARCRLDAMRGAAEAAGGMGRAFEGGAPSFFYQGGNGRGRRFLDDDILGRFAQAAESGLPPDAVGGAFPRSDDPASTRQSVTR